MDCFGPGRTELAVASRTGARALLIGGTPFDESVLMGWNFVARTPGEIAAARADWVDGRRFGAVAGYDGAPIRRAAARAVRGASRRPMTPSLPSTVTAAHER